MVGGNPGPQIRRHGRRHGRQGTVGLRQTGRVTGPMECGQSSLSSLGTLGTSNIEVPQAQPKAISAISVIPGLGMVQWMKHIK